MEDSQLKEVLSLVRSINSDQFRGDLTVGVGYDQLMQELNFLAQEKKYWIQRSEEILNKLMAMSSGDFNFQISPATRDSELEAIILGVNSFAEEIEASTITKEEYLDSLNSLPYIVWSSNIDFSKVLFVNKATETIFGISQVEMLENKNLWVDIIHPDDRGYVESAFDEFFETGEFNVEYRIINRKTNKIGWIHDSAQFLNDLNGKRYRIVGSCKDVTLEKESILKNKEVTNKLLLAQHIAKMGSWEFNLTTQAVTWSKELYLIFDVDPALGEEKLYEAYRDAIHPDDIQLLDAHVIECATKGIPYDFEHRILVNNKTEIKYIRAIGSPIVDTEGKIIGLNGIGQDFTDKKLIEIQNEKNQKRLEEAQHISKIGSWEWDFTSGNLYWSDEHYRIFEIPFNTDPSVLYETYRSKIHPDDLKVLDPMVENTIKTGQPFEFNHRAILKDGSVRHVRGLGNAIYGLDNEIVGIQGTAQDITESFLQEQKLNGTLADLNAILDSTDYSIIATDLEGTITLFNKGAERILGYKAEEIIHKTSPAIIHVVEEVVARAEVLSKELGEQINPGFDVFIAKLNRFGVTDMNEWTYVRKDGSKLPVMLTCDTVKDVEGNVTGYIGIAKDITNEKNQNAELVKVKTELQSFFQMSSDFLCIINPDTASYEFVNNTFIDVLGYSFEELIGKNVLQFIHPEDKQIVLDDFERVEKTGDLFSDVELRYLSKSNEIIWINWKISIDKTLNKHYGTGRNITEKKKQEESLKTALKLVEDYQKALNQIAIVSITDIQGNITFANEMFTKVSGYTEAELIGKNHRILKSNKNPQGIFEDLWKTISLGDTWRGEVCNVNKLGQEYWVDTLVVPLLDELGKPKQYFSIRYEITEKKQQEKLQVLNQELQKDKEVAEQKTKLKERFLANMSHEIRTPMNSILGLSNLMEKVGTLNPKQMDYIKTIKLNSKNLLSIINDILDLSKIEEGKLEIEQSTFDVVELLKNVEKSLVLTAHKKKITLASEIDERIPNLLIGDATRLNQVLINLTNNAIKFTIEGGVKIVMKLNKLEQKQATIYFAIEDTGIGIDPSKIGAIFEPFTQEKSSTTRLFGGTGLGLTISNQIIHAFGSQIKVKSEPNVGSVFYFEITFELPEIQINNKVVVNSDIIDTSKIDLKGKYRILLVEDNPFNQMVAEDTLKDWNGELEIDIAENGVLAIDKLKHQVYDLILMDIQMPELDGHGATKIARQELGIQTPILAMTAQATPAEIEACLHSGMNDYISKPFDEQLLFAKIVKWLNSDLII